MENGASVSVPIEVPFTRKFIETIELLPELAVALALIVIVETGDCKAKGCAVELSDVLATEVIVTLLGGSANTADTSALKIAAAETRRRKVFI
jgi:hypothetical protein